MSNLFSYLVKDECNITSFCDTLKSIIQVRKGDSVNISFSKSESCIYFFMNGSSSILQIMPDKELKYTYANSAQFETEIRECIHLFGKIEIRNKKISEILKD